MTGYPKTPSCGDWTFYGSLDGTFALARQREDGIVIAAIFNKRYNMDFDAFTETMDKIADNIQNWPQ